MANRYGQQSSGLPSTERSEQYTTVLPSTEESQQSLEQAHDEMINADKDAVETTTSIVLGDTSKETTGSSTSVTDERFIDNKEELEEVLSLDRTDAENAQSSSGLSLLQKIGLTSTRPEILGIHEFIPVIADEEQESTTKSSLNIENGTSYNLTHVSKLIELNRQVQSYVTDTADTVLKELYPEYFSENRLQRIKELTATGVLARNLSKEDIPATVDAIINFIIEEQVNISDFVAENKTSPMLKGLIEHYVLGEIINLLPDYVDNIVISNNDFRSNWGIDKFDNIKPFLAGDISNEDISSDFNNLENLRRENTGNFSIFEKVSGLSTTSSLSGNNTRSLSEITDFSKYANLMMHLFSLTTFLDSSTFLESLKGNDTRILTSGTKYGLKGDLGPIISKIEKISLESYSFVGTGITGRTPSTTLQRIESGNSSDGLFDIIRGIEDSEGSAKPEIETLKELLVFSAFDNTSAKIGKRVSLEVLSNALQQNNINSNIAILNKGEYDLFANNGNFRPKKYFLEYLGLPSNFNIRVSSNLSENNSNNLRPSDGFNLLFNKRTPQEGGYVFGESKPSAYESDYNDLGANYFIDQAIRNQEVDTLGTLTGLYVTQAKELTEDILTLYPDPDIVNEVQPASTDHISLAPIGPVTSKDRLVELFNNIAADLLNHATASGDNHRRQSMLMLFSFLTFEPDDVNLLLNNSFLGCLNAVDYANSTDLDSFSQRTLDDKLEETCVSIIDKQLSKIYSDDSRIINSFYDEIEDLSRQGIGMLIRTGLPEGVDPMSSSTLDSTRNQTHINVRYIFDNLRSSLEQSNQTGSLATMNFGTKGIQRIFASSFESYLEDENIYYDEKLHNVFARDHYVLFMFLRKIIRECVSMEGRISNDQENLHLRFNGLKGMIEGINSALSLVENNSEVQISNSLSGYVKEKESFDKIRNIVLSIFNKLESRQRMIKECLAIFNGHSQALRKVYMSLVGLQSVGEPELFDLMLNLLKDEKFGGNLRNDIVDYTSDTYKNQVLTAKEKHFSIRNNNLIPDDIKSSLSKNIFMHQCLSIPGFGLLEKDKYGKKEIVTVGITNGLIKTLRETLYAESNDPLVFEKSQIVVSIKKIDSLNPDLSLMPKSFIFNANIFVKDVNSDNELPNHLSNINNSNNLTNILKSLELYGSGGASFLGSEVNLSANFPKQMLTNHLFDYVLKHYMHSLSGLDFSESSFLMKLTPNRYRRVFPSLVSGGETIEEYLNILRRLRSAYPEVFDVRQLQAEAERLADCLKQAYPFSNIRRFEKVVRPKTFDRTFSMLVHEKDFLPIGPVNEDYDFFNPNMPDFNSTSKISRPEILPARTQAQPQGVIVDAPVRRYMSSLEENQPEVYHYSATISLLNEETSIFIDDSDEDSNSNAVFEPSALATTEVE